MIKKFFFRAIIGVLFILCINAILTYCGLSLSVGINPLTVLTSGVLGLPGVGLLYGILAL
ncbi:MAG: pro-sigmaK processing inhibitor BofA family protein [Faecalimonas sp.]|nr:pro-sigmaK processing inhibitor BofA family protein [Faecalimonas sp.]